MTARPDRQRGSAALTTLALTVVVMTLSVLVADVAQVLVARTRAQVAADAAALAAAPVTFRDFGSADGPEGEAARFASRNGARLVECRCAVDRSWSARRVTVRTAVAIDLVLLPAAEIGATAHADFDPIRLHE